MESQARSMGLRIIRRPYLEWPTPMIAARSFRSKLGIDRTPGSTLGISRQAVLAGAERTKKLRPMSNRLLRGLPLEARCRMNDDEPDPRRIRAGLWDVG